MDIRLQQFIDEVFEHIKEKYPGLFYAYDICNEVVSSMSLEDHPIGKMFMETTHLLQRHLNWQEKLQKVLV